MANDPNTFSDSNGGREKPKKFQDTKLTKRAPRGVSSSLLKFIFSIFLFSFFPFWKISKGPKQFQKQLKINLKNNSKILAENGKFDSRAKKARQEGFCMVNFS